MASHSFLVLLAIGLFVAAASARVLESPSVKASDVEFDFDEFDFDEFEGLSDDVVQRGWKSYLKKLGAKAVKAALNVFQEEIAQIKFECVEEIVEFCKINPITHPKKLYKCGKAWYKEHKSHCRKDKTDPETPVDDFESNETEDKKVEEEVKVEAPQEEVKVEATQE